MLGFVPQPNLQLQLLMLGFVPQPNLQLSRISNLNVGFRTSTQPTTQGFCRIL